MIDKALRNRILHNKNDEVANFLINPAKLDFLRIYKFCKCFESKPFSTSYAPYSEGSEELHFSDIYPSLISWGMTILTQKKNKSATNIVNSVFSDSIPAQGLANVQNIAGSDSVLNNILLKTSVKSLEDRAFAGSDLNKIYFGGGLTKLGIDTFNGCTKLTTVDFRSAKFTEVPTGAFCNCPNLRVVVLPPTLQVIMGGAFDNVSNDIKIYVPYKDSGDQILISGTDKPFLKQHIVPYKVEKFAAPEGAEYMPAEVSEEEALEGKE